MLTFKPAFSLSFSFIKRLFSSSSLSAIKVVSSTCLRLLILLPAILIPAFKSSSLAFCLMYSAYKLNKQSDNILLWPMDSMVACQAPLSTGFSRKEYWSGFPFPSPGIFPTQGSNLGLLHCRQSVYQQSYEGNLTIYSLALLLCQFWTSPLFHLQFCCFLSCIQVSQEAWKMVWYSHLFKNILQFVVIHTVKVFSIGSEAEVDISQNSLAFPMIQQMLAIWLWFLWLF